MFDILLSTQSEQPMYIQLYRQMRNQIRNGGISPGTRLPSVRSVQLQMNISKTPIETAYQMLLAEGYVHSKPRSGLYVIDPHTDNPASPAHPDPVRAFSAMHPTRAEPVPQKVAVDFDPSAVDESLFPLRIWRKMLHEALDSHAGVCRYGDAQGEYSLRLVLAEYLKNSRGVNCSPEQIVVGSGISYSIDVLSKLLSGRQTIGFEEPGFAPVREQFKHNSFQVISIPVTDKGLSLDELEKSDANAVYVTPSHQFPLGPVMPYAERERLLAWARARRAYVLEDDYDGEFRYFGKPISSLQGIDRDGRVIYIGTFSKAFTPALRLNYMVLPVELAEKMQRMPYLLNSPSRIDQWAMQAFFEQGHWYRHIRRVRNAYRKKHQRFVEQLQLHFGERIEITGHSAGLHLLVTIRTDRCSRTLLELASQQGVRVYDFSQMWMETPRTPRYPQLYLGFGGTSERDIELGVKLLQKAWHEILV
ncbi:UNVERIFIED_CONTAM: GntR family transcriptional regulator/MocR family aminotransferase [Brevibacillus sp. OAP136]